ncbi:unnamed protein product [Phytophthora fragariaefolia]|uniref:Unnamed protein product n=1 Tax=Phytophthora fragariaefolia TaxID=1490495 RepID=A0A9W6YKD4_9STRA|nr:unnamed protein product [Phytophthora fragariaefolia]
MHDDKLHPVRFCGRVLKDSELNYHPAEKEVLALLLGGDLSIARRSFATLQRKVADAPILRHFDKSKDVHLMLFANEWALSTTILQMHDDKLHPVRFCGRVLKDSELNYHPAEKEVLALLLGGDLSIARRSFATLQRKVADAPILRHFDKSKDVHLMLFANEWALSIHPLLNARLDLQVQRVKEKDCAFTQLLHATVTNFVDLDEALAPVAPPKQGSPTTRLDPSLLYARIPISHACFVVSFDGSAKTTKFGGYGSCSWIVWRLPDWKIVIAASPYLETTTVNLAEYTGMNNDVLAALELGADNLIIVGDSRLAIQQSLGVIACREESLMTMLNRHRELTARLRSVKYLHVVRECNAAADSLAGEALEAKVSKVVLSDERKKELSGLNRIQDVIYESSAEEPTANQPESRNFVQIVNGTKKSKHQQITEPF